MIDVAHRASSFQRRATERWAAVVRSKPAVAVIVVLALLTIAPLSLPGGADRANNDARQFNAGPMSGQQRLVFAHYFPPYPISLDNLDPKKDYYAAVYLNPSGMEGEYGPYGAMLRDRPVPRPPRAETDWREVDLAVEIQQAMAAGIDGFSVDILTTIEDKSWVAAVPSMMLRVAERIGAPFKIMLMPDMHGELGSLTPAQLADQLAKLASSPAAFRLDDGRLVVSPFKAENRSPLWWQEFLTQMKTRHDIDVALLPVFVDGDAETMRSFNSISFGMGSWGGRNPAFNPVQGFSTDAIKQTHGFGKLWMQPVSMQDYRPAHQIFDESENTTNLRNTWHIAIEGGADWVQLVTWNDYSESTALAPSVRHGTALLELTSYYIRFFKAGEPPPITDDRVFLSHRTQRIDSGPYPDQTAVATLRQGSVPSRDAVEALSFLTAPATVVVRIGPDETVCELPAGVSACVAPLDPLEAAEVSVSVEVRRDDETVLQLTSPFPVVARPAVQDLSYVVSEGRSSDG